MDLAVLSQCMHWQAFSLFRDLVGSGRQREVLACADSPAILNPMAHRQCQLRTHHNFSSVVWALTRLGSWSACVVLEVWRQPTWLYAHASGVGYVLPALPLVGVPV